MDKLLLSFLEALPLPTTGVDRDGRVVLWNRAAEGALGWPAREVMGMPHPAIPPELEAQHAEMRAAIFQGVVGERLETRRLRKDGSAFDVVITTAGARGKSGEIEVAMGVYHDDSQRRVAERRFRSAEHRFRSLLEMPIDVALLIVGPDGQVIDRNGAAEEIVSPTVVRMEELARQQTHTAERWYQRRDGSRFWADIIISPIAAERGGSAEYIVMIRDASDRKRAQDEVQQRSARNEAVAAFAQRAISERDRNVLAQAAVSHALAALEADRAELLCLLPDGAALEVTHDACPDGSSTGTRVDTGSGAIQSEALAGPMQRALGEADRQAAIHLAQMKYGAAAAVMSGDQTFVLAAYSSAEPFDVQALYPLQAIGATYAAAMARGVAEAQLADREARLHMLLEQIPGIVSTLDPDLRFVSAQGAALGLLGMQAEDLVGLTLRDISGHDERAAPVVAGKRAIRGEANRYEWTFRARTFENRMEPLRDDSGTITGIINLGLDVTEQRHAERELLHSREELRRLSAAMHRAQEQERKRIAREVHDELGQRLTALRLDLGLLRNEVRGDELDAAEERMAMMLGLIDETISTVRHVATQLRPAILDDFGFRAAVENELKTLHHRTGIETELVIEPPELNVAPEHATALYRIIQEALTNVARHSGATRVEVRIAASELGLEADIRDNGRGITPEEIDNPASVGILGVRERAYALGGQAIIEGSPDRGTRVSVTIPK
jgi:PAS domain S-box-containing protein